MKIKYSVKKFNPNIISVGDWVYHPSWHTDSSPKYIYKVCKIHNEKIRITVNTLMYDCEYPVDNYFTKVDPKDIDKFILHE